MDRSLVVLLAAIGSFVPATARAQGAVPSGRSFFAISLSELALSVNIEEEAFSEAVLGAETPEEEAPEARSRELLQSRRLMRAGWLGLAMAGPAFVMHPMMTCVSPQAYESGGSCTDSPRHRAGVRALIGINTTAVLGTLAMGALGTARMSRLRREGLTFPASSGGRRLAMAIGWLAYAAGLLVLPFASGIVVADSVSS